MSKGQRRAVIELLIGESNAEVRKRIRIRRGRKAGLHWLRHWTGLLRGQHRSARAQRKAHDDAAGEIHFPVRPAGLPASTTCTAMFSIASGAMLTNSGRLTARFAAVALSIRIAGLSWPSASMWVRYIWVKNERPFDEKTIQRPLG